MTSLYTVDLCLGYPRNPLFEKLNLKLSESSITCLIGRNGAGKSTLIRTLSGIQKPLGGHVFLNHADMAKMAEKEIAKQLSIVLTDPVKTPYMTVDELVSFGRYPHLGGQAKMSIDDRDIINRAIGEVGIAPLKNRRLTTLSDGERQKAVLARAIAQQTAFIMLDEPAAFLDFPSKIELMRLLKKLAVNTSKSILLSTHDIELALALSDTIWLIDKDRTLMAGSPETLINNHIIAETFEISTSFFEQTVQRYRTLYEEFHEI